MNIFVKDNLTGETFKVRLNGYQQKVSASSFRQLLLVVPYKLPKTYKVGFSFKYSFDLEPLTEVDAIFNDLYCFYDHIGYTKATKKFHNKTYRQFLLERLNG